MLFFLLRLLFSVLAPSGEGGLSMAARTDGRVEQMPADRAFADRWQGRKRPAAARRSANAPMLRAGGAGPSSTERHE